MLPAPSRHTLLATAVLALASFFWLPWLASAVVRAALENTAAADRVAYAAGQSPWSWRFRGTSDVVAGRAFGPGKVEEGDSALRLSVTGAGPVQVGLPLSRPADIQTLNLLRLDADATQVGDYSVVVRPALDAPGLRASLGSRQGAGGPGTYQLDGLAWYDESGHWAPAPRRAAMLRLEVRLPPGAVLSLRGASLAHATGPLPENGVIVPSGATAEALLRWRDRLQARDPLVTFGQQAAPFQPPGWLGWLAVAAYAGALGAAGLATWRRSAQVARGGDLANAALTLTGPLWFIVGLGLGPRPSHPGLAMFLMGVAYGVFLTWRRALPRWHWRGRWRMSGWPLLAIPVAVAIVAVAGHAPVWPSAGRALLYLGWAFFQQWLMLAVFTGLLARALPRPFAVLAAATVFALLHTPNGLLMQLCFVAELGWGWWYVHHRSLLPVALAHAASAVILQACLAGGILRSLEVSARFLS